MRYRIERRPRSDYGQYLAMHGSVYGDMSDPAQRAVAVASLRRRDALMIASMRREEWREIRELPTEEIRAQMRVKRYQIEQCGDFRPWNVRNADIHTYRILARELLSRTGRA